MSGPRRVSGMVPSLAGKALSRKGLGYGQLVTEWARLVGPDLAGWTAPAKLSFPRGERANATLTIEVGGARAVELQHQMPQLLERVNGFFGYTAVARIKLVQSMPAMPPPRRTNLRKLTEGEERELKGMVKLVEDDALKAALESLGRLVAAKG